MVVEHVDQPGEAARLGCLARPHPGHAGQDHRVETVGQFQVVVLRTRTAAKRGEVEPHHRARKRERTDFAVFDVQHRFLGRRIGQRVEGLLQRLLGMLIQRRVIALHLLQRTAAVVDAGVHVHDVHARLDQLDRGQLAVPVQAVGVQCGRLVIGRHHE
ncbi:hypothetical protein D9M69_625160 [compost metagenome]